MIILFEPQCTGIGHEQFNAGFLYGYTLAYPEEMIVFFGEKEHLKCVQVIFAKNNISIRNITFSEIEIPNANSPASFFEYIKILNKILLYATENKSKKLVLLSIHTHNLIPLKYILQTKYHNSIQVHIVMHGILESIKRKNWPSLIDISRKIYRRVRKFLGIDLIKKKVEPTNHYLFEKTFKFSLHLFSNKNITYFVFRDDSLNKINHYLPKIHNHFKSIDLPYIFDSQNIQIDTSKVISFTAFEKEYADELTKIVSTLIKEETIVDKFELCIIGSRTNKILSEYKPVKFLENQKKLTREEIDRLIKDTSYLLFFYPEYSYELTTSGMFFDAIAYCKPVIFLSNPCINFYFDRYKFGYKCNNLDEMISVMKKLILAEDIHYQDFISEIRRMQQATSIKNNYHKLMFNVSQNIINEKDLG